MYTIVICDSNKNNIKILTSALQYFSKTAPQYALKIYTFHSSFELTNFLGRGENADLYFLTTMLPTPEESIALGRTIHDHNPYVPIVFLAPDRKFLPQIFNAHPFSYLLPPLKGADILSVLEDAFRQAAPANDTLMSIKTRDGLEVFDRSLLISIEYKNHQLLANVHNRECIKSTTIRISFHNWLAPLLKYDCFITPHKSFLINMNHVKSLTGSHTFIMRNGSTIPIASQSFPQIKKRFLEYSSQPYKIL